KDHVNLFLYDGAIVPDAHGIITGGHGNKTARTIAFRRGDSVPRPAPTPLLLPIAAHNRAGGRRQIKEGPAVPPLAYARRSGGPRESHRRAPTDPCVNSLPLHGSCHPVHQE